MNKLTFFAALALSGCLTLPAIAQSTDKPLLETSLSKKSAKAVSKHKAHRKIGSGIASFYGGGEKLNAHTANGERFNPRAMTAAHRTLPLGSIVVVTNQNSGRKCTVRINDRGPAAWTGRVIDLSRGAAQACGIHGVGPVSLEKVG